jgi:hypothetical protein
MLKPVRRTSRALGAALALSAAACGDQIAAPTSQPGPVRLLIVSGDVQTAPPGAELPQPIVVKVVDGNGDPVPNQIVNFRVVQGGGSVFAGAALTNAQGLAQEHWTLGSSPSVPPGSAGAQRIEVRAVDSGTGQKQVFGRFTAFALAPAVITGRAVGDSASLYAKLAGGPYTYVWDIGDNTGTFRKFGETQLSAVENLIVPNDRTLWFCYYARNDEGLRSSWQCSYTGGKF